MPVIDPRYNQLVLSDEGMSKEFIESIYKIEEAAWGELLIVSDDIWNHYPRFVPCYYYWREEADIIHDHGHWIFRLKYGTKEELGDYDIFPELNRVRYRDYGLCLWINNNGRLIWS